MGASEELVSLRRAFHRRPEPGWEEFWTTATVAAELDELGFDLSFGPDIMDSADRLGVPSDDVLAAARSRARDWGAPDYLDRMDDVTGLVAERTYGDGPTVGIRCDLDALPQTEATTEDHRPAQEGFESRNPGAMHACGHDGHVAMAIGIARALDADPGRFDGTLRFVFQPAEEGLRGGHPLARSDALAGIDYLFAYHLGLGVPSGEIVAGATGFLASTKLNAVYRGHTGHAGQAPETGRNALKAATTATENLLAIPRHSDGSTRVNVGRLEAGTARNAIPGEATLALEVRGESTTINEYMEGQARRILTAAADMHDVDIDVTVEGKTITEAADEDLVSLTERGLRDAGHVQSVSRHCEVEVSEDATYIMRRVHEDGGQATYVVVGTDLASGHHTTTFDFDESVLRPAVESFSHLVRETIPTTD